MIPNHVAPDDARMQEMDTSLPIGRMIQRRYVIEDILGKGEFGTAYQQR